MNRLESINVRNTLPSSISFDENVQALSEVLSIKLISLVPSIDTLTILPNLSKLPDAVVDELAWHFHVDFYDATKTRAEREELVYKSIAWHRIKGTPGALEEAIKSLYSEAKVLENWEYENGRPYGFKLLMEGYMVDKDTKAQILNVIDMVKNTRSWLDDLEYAHNIDGNIIYTGGQVSSANHSLIEPNLGLELEDLSVNAYTAATVFIMQEITI